MAHSTEQIGFKRFINSLHFSLYSLRNGSLSPWKRPTSTNLGGRNGLVLGNMRLNIYYTNQCASSVTKHCCLTTRVSLNDFRSVMLKKTTLR